MSSFDGMINKAKDFMSATGKKTNDVFEITKLKVEKLNKEADLQKNYEKLGKVCYLNYKNTTCSSENTEELINEIKSIEKEIKKITEKISDMKNIKTCKKCGNKNNKKSVYCSLCGEPLYSSEQNSNNSLANNDSSGVTMEFDSENIANEFLTQKENKENK